MFKLSRPSLTPLLLGLLALGGQAIQERPVKRATLGARPPERAETSAEAQHRTGEGSTSDDLSGASVSAEIWKHLLEGNQRFVSGKTRTRGGQDLRHELSAGQHPAVIVLACADSRVAPELVFDADLGELFVVRTAGNVADPVALGSIEYAVEHLHSRVLVVLGHESCGAVTAASSGEPMPTRNLQAIVDHIAPALELLRLSYEGKELVQRGIDANVHCSARALLADSPIVQHAVESGELRVVKARYDLEDGVVRTLE